MFWVIWLNTSIKKHTITPIANTSDITISILAISSFSYNKNKADTSANEKANDKKTNAIIIMVCCVCLVKDM